MCSFPGCSYGIADIAHKPGVYYFLQVIDTELENQVGKRVSKLFFSVCLSLSLSLSVVP